MDLFIDSAERNSSSRLKFTIDDAVCALGLPKRKRRELHEAYRTALPYGCRTCADGRGVLFNRRYRPIWQRRQAADTAERADSDEWVPWETQEWFYEGSTGRLPPRYDRRTREYLLQVLVEFGVRLGEPA